MAHPRCLTHSSPARALHQVLVSDLSATTPSLGRQTAYYLLPPRLFSSYNHFFAKRQALPSPAPPQIRFFSTSPALHRAPTFKQRPTNNDIPYRWVRVSGDDGLSAPQPTARVLASLDPKTHTLVMVAPPPPAPESDSDSSPSGPVLVAPPAAICLIVDNAAAAAAEAEARQALRRKAAETKELELSWSITPHDLSHKMKKMRELLSKGFVVEVILAKKRGGRVATKEESEAILVAIREAMTQIEGAKEYRKMDGAVGGMAKLFFRGPTSKKRNKNKKTEEEATGEEEED